jgi:hypothetical protein
MHEVGSGMFGSLGRRAAASGGAPLAVALVLLIGVQPVFAEECAPTVAGFPPGDWAAHGIYTYTVDTDDRSTVILSASGGFTVNIGDTGMARGSFSQAGQGSAASWADDSYAEAQYLRTGKIEGTSTHLRVDGETLWTIGGLIDDKPNEAGSNSFSAFGGNEFSVPYDAQFSPSAANCNQVFGSLGGPVQYGTEADGGDAHFMAVRTSRAPGDPDVQGRLAELMEDAQHVSGMDPVDTDVLARFVYDMLAFDSLLASLEACDPGAQLQMGPTWQLLQAVMLDAMRLLVQAAEGGAYSTADVIFALSVWIQGGSLGWRADDCLAPIADDEVAMGLFTKFEDVLLIRLEGAIEAANQAEIALIRNAAYQYGMPRVIAALEAM